MDIMLDLETLSSAPDAAIVSIGACTFNAPERERFYIVVDAESAQRAGGRIDAATCCWWMQQSDAARSVFNAIEVVPLYHALDQFGEWLEPWRAHLRLWGNGSDFDNVILRGAYERLGRKAPWSHRQNRCYRTLKNLRPEIGIEPHGVHHNALDDALAQARHAEALLAAAGA